MPFVVTAVMGDLHVPSKTYPNKLAAMDKNCAAVQTRPEIGEGYDGR
jgi:hypothetical protein